VVELDVDELAIMIERNHGEEKRGEGGSGQRREGELLDFALISRTLETLCANEGIAFRDMRKDMYKSRENKGTRNKEEAI